MTTSSSRIFLIIWLSNWRNSVSNTRNVFNIGIPVSPSGFLSPFARLRSQAKLRAVPPTGRQVAQMPSNGPATLLLPIAFVMAAARRSRCTLPSDEPAWDTSLPFPPQGRHRPVPLQLQTTCRTHTTAEPDSGDGSSSPSSGDLNTSQPFILGSPSPPPRIVPWYITLLFVLSSFAFKFIFGVFSPQQKALKLLSEITLLSSMTKYPGAGCWGIKKKHTKKKPWFTETCKLRKKQLLLLLQQTSLMCTTSSPLGIGTSGWSTRRALPWVLVAEHVPLPLRVTYTRHVKHRNKA